MESCFKIRKTSKFIIGEKIDFSKLAIVYSEDSESNRDKLLKKYVSVDSVFSIQNNNSNIIGSLMFSSEINTHNLVSLNGFWMFMMGDNEVDRKDGLKLIKAKYLPCLLTERLDTKNGSEYEVNKNGVVEKFILKPRVGEDKIDVNYWSFYYSIK